jgi:hypothetical protein
VVSFSPFLASTSRRHPAGCLTVTGLTFGDNCLESYALRCGLLLLLLLLLSKVKIKIKLSLCFN